MTQPDDRELSMYRLIGRPSRDNAFTLFSKLASHDPVHWDPYTKTWLVAERSAAVAVLADPRFSSQPSRFVHPDLTHSSASYPRLADTLQRQLIFSDGADHARLRPVVDAVLSPRRVRRLAGEIQAFVDKVITPGGKLDAVAELAVPLPITVISQLLGLPPIGQHELLAMSDAYTRAITGIDRTVDVRTLTLIEDFLNYALETIRGKRHADDGTGAAEMIAHANRLGGITELDLAANLVMLISAGHQTTSGFLAGAILNRCQDKDRIRQSIGQEVEAALAAVSPSQFIGRTATMDSWVGGRHIRAGQSVLVLLAAVNWSGIGQASGPKPLRHLAFGHGAHGCPGALLARLEARLVLDRLRHCEPVLFPGPIRWSTNVNLPCLVELPIKLGHVRETDRKERL